MPRPSLRLALVPLVALACGGGSATPDNSVAATWEITEPMQAYQGPFVLLVSFFMGPG